MFFKGMRDDNNSFKIFHNALRVDGVFLLMLCTTIIVSLLSSTFHTLIFGAFFLRNVELICFSLFSIKLKIRLDMITDVVSIMQQGFINKECRFLLGISTRDLKLICRYCTATITSFLSFFYIHRPIMTPKAFLILYPIIVLVMQTHVQKIFLYIVAQK